MVKVILVSPDYKHSYKNIDTESLGYRIIPFSLAYLGSVIKKQGHDVRIIDLNTLNNPLDEFKLLLNKEKPDFVGISCMTPSSDRAVQIAKISKEYSKKIRVLIGGYHPTALPFDVIKNESIDFLLLGESEKSMVQLVNGVSLKKIKGLMYKKDGKIIKNPGRSMISDLDTLPYPLYSEFYETGDTLKKYGTPTLRSTTGLVESRGCPYNCIFCANKLMNKGKVRVRSPRNVVSEIEMLYQKYGITNFSFYDSAIMLDKKRLHKLCEEVIKRKLKIRWMCSSRVDLVNKETLKLIKKAGCTSIYFGIESGDPKILEIIKKNVTLEQVEKAINLTKKVGITCVGLFMLGHPFETEESIRKTINFAKGLPLDYAEFNITIPLPGTELWRIAENKNGIEILAKSWDEYVAYGKPAIRTPGLTRKQLERYQRLAYRKFYLRPRYILRILTNQGLIQNLKKGFVLLRFLIHK